VGSQRTNGIETKRNINNKKDGYIMEKKKLLSFIKKYYLNGTCDRVILHTDGKGNIATKFVSEPEKTLVGIVKESGFDSLKDEHSFGIYSTGKLKDLVSVLDDEIEIKPNSFSDKTVALDFSDAASTVHFALSELNMIPKAPKEIKEPEYEVEITLDSAFINKFVKARAALSEYKQYTVVSGKEVKFVIGETKKTNTNNAVIVVSPPNVIKSETMKEAIFDIGNFKEVLTANDGDFETATMKISSKGLATILFKGKDYSATYYLVGLGDDE
jgi:hypothetical protein